MTKEPVTNALMAALALCEQSARGHNASAPRSGLSQSPGDAPPAKKDSNGAK